MKVLINTANIPPLKSLSNIAFLPT